MTAAEDLRAAAEIIRVRGHCKGRLEDDEGRVCLAGALLVARHESAKMTNQPWPVEFGDVDPVLTAVTREQFPDRSLGIGAYVTFNNHPDTTPEEVIGVLEKAAARLEESVT
jgi:hypothetical protein